MSRAQLPPCILCGASAVPVMVCGLDGYVMHGLEYTARLGYACPLMTGRHYTATDWRAVHEPRPTKRGKWQRAKVDQFGGAVEVGAVLVEVFSLGRFRELFGFLPPDAETEVVFRCHVEVKAAKARKGKS